MQENAARTGALALSGSWDGSLIAQINEINAQFLEITRSRLLEHGGAPTMQSELRLLWRALQPAHIRALASCPYLLMDAGFDWPEYWNHAVPPGVRDAASQPMDSELIHRVLVLAWHLARANPYAARVTLGLASPCAALIAATRLRDLERIARSGPPWIRLRWEAQPTVWRQWLEAVTQGHSSRLQLMQWRGFQLLARNATAAS